MYDLFNLIAEYICSNLFVIGWEMIVFGLGLIISTIFTF